MGCRERLPSVVLRRHRTGRGEALLVGKDGRISYEAFANALKERKKWRRRPVRTDPQLQEESVDWQLIQPVPRVSLATKRPA